MFQASEGAEELRPRITVFGVGGAGNNAVGAMVARGLQGVELVAANTDAQALAMSAAPLTLQLGRGTTAGLGAGSCAATGRAAAEDCRAEIAACLQGSHMCFIAAGMGGGTGTGAAPVIAAVARELGILTVAAVTRPFDFEGARRRRLAEEGLEALAAQVDSLIVVPNQNLYRVIGASTTLRAALALADDVLYHGVRSITDLMVLPGLINLDFADVRTVLTNTGRARIGTGEASGDDRARRAAVQAMTDPLLDDQIGGAEGLLISISGGDDLLLFEVDEAARQITALAHPEADIIWGSSRDPALEGRIRVSIVAAGLGRRAAQVPAAPEASHGALRGETALPAKPTAGGVEEDLPPEPAAEAEAPKTPSLFERMASAAQDRSARCLPLPPHESAPRRRLVVHDQYAA